MAIGVASATPMIPSAVPEHFAVGSSLGNVMLSSLIIPQFASSPPERAAVWPAWSICVLYLCALFASQAL